MGKYSNINVCCHINKQSKICFQNICKTGYVLLLNCKRLFKNKKFDIFPFWKKSWNNFSHYKGLQESFYILQTQNERMMILDLLHFMRMWKFTLFVPTMRSTFPLKHWLLSNIPIVVWKYNSFVLTILNIMYFPLHINLYFRLIWLGLFTYLRQASNTNQIWSPTFL